MSFSAKGAPPDAAASGELAVKASALDALGGTPKLAGGGMFKFGDGQGPALIPSSLTCIVGHEGGPGAFYLGRWGGVAGSHRVAGQPWGVGKLTVPGAVVMRGLH
uniref:Uncharacterized protein n=1 Tax=Alexandrium monilatum TaxID=311494 RepID=A0A7S4RYG6_9DINO|mmetsp:Transcript_43061/g.128612  ORF Transcript_43061/g.128612 Transcript_43061/m.128612 type:complete len:105 (-) Transcript_43061:49-363(-)